MTKPRKFRTNSLYYFANKYKQSLTSEEELEKIDMTDVFYAELEEMIKQGEIIIININAKVRLGKSTEAFALGSHILELLKKHKLTAEKKFGLKNIARDHQEHSKLMRDPKTRFTVIVTDEANDLEETGENVTVEKALDRVFSNVQAARYVHRVCCSPKETIDPNADILLSVISIDKRTYTTHNKLYFRFYEGGQEHIQLLGYVNVYVGNIIKTWEEKSKRLFYSPNRTEKEEKELLRLKHKDWYTMYVVKKHEKMELITKEGIFKPRMLDYAEITLETINKLVKLTKIRGLLNKEIVRNYIKMGFREAKIPQSIIGEKLATDEVMGVLELYKSIFALKDKEKAIKKQWRENKINDETMKAIVKNIDEMSKEIQTAIDLQREELEKYKEINAKYKMKR